jgi:hypothetical protein
MKLIEIWYYIWNTPYIEAHILKDTRIIKTLVHPIISNTTTGEMEISWKNKFGWFILPNSCFIKRNKFISYLDLENCIPLVEETKVITEASELLISEKTITTLKKAGVEIIDYNTDKTGRQKIFKGAIIPPTVFHQMMSAHFIRETLRNPPSKWEEMKWAIIAAVVGLVIIAGLYITSSGASPLG